MKYDSNSDENDEMGHTARSGRSWAKSITALYVFWRASALTTRSSCLCAKASSPDAPRVTVPLTELYDMTISGAAGISRGFRADERRLERSRIR